MTLLADTSYIYGLFNHKDPNHAKAISFAKKVTEEIRVPIVTLPEITFLFGRDENYYQVQEFLRVFAQTEIPIEAVYKSDLQRVAEIMGTYASAEFDLVDCCIMAVAERLNITQICTFDRRDFSIFRPRHCSYFELLP